MPLLEPLSLLMYHFLICQHYKSCPFSCTSAHLPGETENTPRYQYILEASALLQKVGMIFFFQSRRVINLCLVFHSLSAVLTTSPQYFSTVAAASIPPGYMQSWWELYLTPQLHGSFPVPNLSPQPSQTRPDFIKLPLFIAY